MTQRPIKFRAWDAADITVYKDAHDPWRMSSYGPQFTMDDCQNLLSFITEAGDAGPLGDRGSMERYKLMQFTGLLDKNGKEIYEGDIVAQTFNRTTKLRKEKTVHNHSVVWNEIKAQWFGKNISLHKISSVSEIIGNIYDNPELLTSTNI
jgi:uncharacterized phage protein (TIGR01671 family)